MRPDMCGTFSHFVAACMQSFSLKGMALNEEEGKVNSIAETNSNELEGGGDPDAEGNIRDMEEDEVHVVEGNMILPHGGKVLEPYVGMEFESEDAGREFYIDYARRVGFVVRIMQRRRSEIDGRTLARRLGCNKQGFSPNHQGKIGSNRKPRSSAREGCQATILVKMERSGKWVVTRFVKDHNHPLIVTSQRLTVVGDKDKKIEKLTQELQRQDELCVLYRTRLLNFLASIEGQAEELSSKIRDVVENVKKVEAEVQKLSHNRWCQH